MSYDREAQDWLETFIGGETIPASKLADLLSSPKVSKAQGLLIQVAGVTLTKTSPSQDHSEPLSPKVGKRAKILDKAHENAKQVLKTLARTGRGTVVDVIEGCGGDVPTWEKPIQWLRKYGHIKSTDQREDRYRVYRVTRGGRSWLDS